VEVLFFDEGGLSLSNDPLKFGDDKLSHGHYGRKEIR